ncbi:hypothetical protein [Bacteriovorax sp. Seq25_V]|uniref:hypothetical protein n=1 Tax=Bacteriovorax sp. Seq25_V TaxID=1201288 RepID=UPI00038A01FE|nr:hypothetical protein [Bacteriovorax sp. Seq25_V]EQC46952.1 hypothetical protein M900_2543 [Bacteriovorax sp. Seq25_V]
MSQNKLLQEVIKYHQFYKTNYSNKFRISLEEKILESNCVGYIRDFYERNGIVLPVRACEIFENLKESSNFLKINSLDELLPGDLILWRKTLVPSSGDSGHICIFKELISKNRISVYDIAKDPHDNDTRSESGLGFGEIEILLDDSCHPCGFKWLGDSKKTKFTEILLVRYK